MGEKILTFTKMIFKGSESFQLNKKSDYSQYIPTNAKQLSVQTWTHLGSNLRNAMNKVGGQNGKI